MLAFILYLVLQAVGIVVLSAVFFVIATGASERYITVDPFKNFYLSLAVPVLGLVLPFFMTHEYWATSQFALWLFVVSVALQVISAVQGMALRGETRDALSIIGWGLVRSIIMTVAYIIFAVTVMN